MTKDITHQDNLQQDAENYLIFFHLFDSLGPKQKRIVWTLHDLHIKYRGNIFIGQQKLAEVIPCCRKHINRTIAKLTNLGYIKKRRRRRMTNVYELGKILTDPLLKSKWKSCQFQSSQVTSKVTSRIDDVPYNINDLDSKNDPLPYLPQNLNIRNTNRDVPFKKIKPIFEDWDWPISDKIAFSKYSDKEIDQAFDQLVGFQEQGGKVDNVIRFFQAKLHEARKGIPPKSYGSPPLYLKKLGLPEKDALTFRQYSEADIVFAKERAQWYLREVGPINNPAGFLHTILKEKR